MTDREFIKVLKNSIRPDDDSLFISKETLLDVIEVMERQQENIDDLQAYINELKEEANAKRRGN